MFIFRGNSRTFWSYGMLLNGVFMKKLVRFCHFRRFHFLDVIFGAKNRTFSLVSHIECYPASELGPRLLLCVLFFRLVMCDVWCIRPKNSAQELLLCVLFFRLVMCDVWCIRPKNSAQELGSRTSSFLSACNV